MTQTPVPRSARGARLRRFLSAGLLACSLLIANSGSAQAPPPAAPAWDGHVVWVLPFDNQSAQPGVEWIGASFPDLINQRLSSAGFLTIRLEDRRYALKHLGLPVDFHPTRATTYRIAQTLDVDYLVFGSYAVANGRIKATAQVLEMHGPRMDPAVRESGDLGQLIHIENALAWKAATQMQPAFTVEEQTFLAASRDLRLDAFEDYIRGELDSTSQDQISHLSKAVQLSPNYTQAWLALGKAYFADQQYEQAIGPLSKVPKGSRYSLEARFYAGLSALYTGNYLQAQTEFSSIASVLPMPAVLNNEGIAINRRGQNGTALFQRVVQLNPQNADYWFNLAVSERRMKNYPAALQAVAHCLALKPQDEEVQNLRTNLMMLRDGRGFHQVAAAAQTADQAASPAPEENGAVDDPPAGNNLPDAQSSPTPSSTSKDASSAPQASAASPDYEPLERIARSYDESAFRQAAFAMEQMDAMKLQSMPGPQRAKLLAQQGESYIRDGLLLEAQRQFRLALASDPESAAAYAGLAQVHEYAGSPAVAQQEAEKSVQMQPNAGAYLVLARLALAKRSLQEALQNVDRALALDPKNTAAQGVLQAIESQQSR